MLVEKIIVDDAIFFLLRNKSWLERTKIIQISPFPCVNITVKGDSWMPSSFVRKIGDASVMS